ncbi:adenosylcobinamide-phosphate synthase CbiB [Zavarzinia sp.]|uniref:adenosylcobinamide-phosphate synthase CbiB n=1 Tax=Zavarzinia sp. TaxID=2027920 RepID=UPI003568C924
MTIAAHFDSSFTLLALALALEAALGYPQALVARIGHPVMWIGALIAWLDRSQNKPELPDLLRRLNGIAALALVLAVAVLPAALLSDLAARFLPPLAALAGLGLLASTLLAQRSLHTHVAAVAAALENGGLEAGRQAVSMIVGRNTKTLDEAGVARAAIESLAENFSDGIVSPALWCGAAGLPGIAAYKAINTADSMIGHRTERHAAFGWAAARIDDLVNLPGARLSALWLALACFALPGSSARGALRAVFRDARRHRSPNGGYPEAAMAGALGLRLNGPKVYGERLSDDAWMGDGRAEAGAADIRRALALYVRACLVQWAAVALAAIWIHYS